MLLQDEGLVLLFWPGEICGLSAARCVEVGKEAVQGVRQGGVAAGQLTAVFLVRHGPDASPHVPGVVIIEVFLNALLVPELGLLNSTLQF